MKKNTNTKCIDVEENSDVRLKFICSGIKLIAEHGFEGTSVRKISANAGQNLGSVSYYFGDKRGLYSAVAEYLVNELQNGSNKNFLNEIHDALNKSNISKQEAIKFIKEILRGMIYATHYTNKISNSTLNIWAREQIAPSHVFSFMYQNIHLPVHSLFCRLIGLVFDKQPDCDEVKLRSYTIMGLAVFFQMSQVTIKHGMNWSSIDDKEIESYTKIVLDYAELMLSVANT